VPPKPVRAMTEHLTDQQLVAYVYRALTDDQRAELDHHLAACAGCRTQLAGHQAVQRRVHNHIVARRNEATPPAHMTYATIAQRVYPPYRAMRWGREFNRYFSGALAVAALLALLILLISMFGGAQQVTVGVPPTPTPTVAPTPLLTATPPAKLMWKIEGGANPLIGPSGLALDAEGNLYVVDGGNDRIVKYDQAGQRLAQWGGHGQGDAQFTFGGRQDPPGEGAFVDYYGGIAIDQEGNVYVADTGNARIQRFDRNGNFLLKWGSQGEGEGQFGHIVGVVVDSQGDVYVAEDAPQSRIQKFDRDGKFLLKWVTSPSTTGLPFSPDDIAIDRQDVIYLVDLGSGSIQKVNSNGQFIENWPLLCGRNSVMMSPDSIAVDPNGNVYIADHLANRICKYDRAGQFLARWDIEIIVGSPCGTMSGMVVDTKKNTYVSDTPNNRVLKYSQP